MTLFCSRTISFLIISVCGLFASVAFAVAPAWKIVPDKSSIAFTATQNGAPVTGKFEKFSGDINFDPDHLSECKVKVIVDMNSLSTTYADLTAELKAPAWFNLKMFPEAVFEAATFKKVGDQYQADGTLTIRDQSQPIVLLFTFTPGAPAMVKGSTTLKRTAFGVGQGEWASATEVKDEVKVDFVVTANK